MHEELTWTGPTVNMAFPYASSGAVVAEGVRLTPIQMVESPARMPAWEA